MTPNRRSVPIACALALGFFGVAVAAAQDSDLARLFPHVAPVESPGDTQLCQLPLTEEVLRATRPDLSDLRLVEADGTLVPTMLDRAAVRWPSGGPPESMAITPEAVERSRDGTAGTVREEMTFRLPEVTLPEGAVWTLTLESGVAEFVHSTTVLAEDGAVLREGSVFRLGSPLRERLEVALPDPAPGKVYTLRLEGQGTEHLGPLLRLVAGPMADRSTELSLPLEIVSQTDADGETIVELVRPSGIVPSQLVFDTDTPFFSQEVEVYDLREGRAPEPIAEGAIFRAEGAGSGLLLPARRGTGERLRVVLARGDSPALENLSVTAVTERPALFFTCRAGQRLLYGGGRANPPRFDTQRFAGTAIGEQIARGNLSEASLGSSTPNPAFDDGPALGALLRAGSPVERKLFRSVAPLEVDGAREGVSRLVPNAALIAHGAPDLADLRVVDAEGRQWPYVRAPGQEELVVPLEVERDDLENGKSRYRLSVPEGELLLDRVRLQTPAGFVRRRFTARLVADDDELVPGLGDQLRGELQRDPGDEAPIEVQLGLGYGAVELVVDNGNDAPLELEAEGVLRAPILYLLAPDGRYEALVGADLPRAEYEVSHALDLVLATEVVDAELGSVTPNPAWEPPPVAPRFSASQIAVWVVLLLAVLVLGILTFRAARGPSAAAASPDGENSATDADSDDETPAAPEADDEGPEKPPGD